MSSQSHPIEIWNVDKLVPYEANAKKHPEEQVEKLANLISKFGWTQPIIVWSDGSIIAGHGRRLAAKHLGMEKVPVIVRGDLTKAEADALRLADNRVTSTDYDQEMIGDELRRLNEALGLDGKGISLADLGFDDKEINFTLSDMGEIDDSFFVDDVSSAVEDQKAANEDVAANLDDSAAPVADALGFKRVTITQSREIRNLMSQVETLTGQGGPEALIHALSLAADRT
jgi:ParB-like chromosome segregation protein Spo0J